MKVRKFLLPILILFLFGTYVSAHPGSTDGDDGHFDHSSGEYHYHHGYPAHEHYDGKCPYDFDDKTSNENYFYDENGDRYTAYPIEQYFDDHDIVLEETESSTEIYDKKENKNEIDDNSNSNKTKSLKVFEAIVTIILVPIIYAGISLVCCIAFAYIVGGAAWILYMPKKIFDWLFKKK